MFQSNVLVKSSECSAEMLLSNVLDNCVITCNSKVFLMVVIKYNHNIIVMLMVICYCQIL